MRSQNVLEEECAWGWLWHADISVERSVSARLWRSPWKRRLAGSAREQSVSQAEFSRLQAQLPLVLDPETLPRLWRGGRCLATPSSVGPGIPRKQRPSLPGASGLRSPFFHLPRRSL